MTRIFGVLILMAQMATGCTFDSAADFQKELTALVEAHASDIDIERLFNRTATQEANDPAYYVAVANHYVEKAQITVISSKPAAAGDLQLTNTATGINAGSISSRFDAATAALAVAALSEAVRRFPDRLDLRFGLAKVYQKEDDATRLLATLDAAAGYTAGHPAGMHWLQGGALPEPAIQFVPETLQDYAKCYFDLNTPADDQRFFGIVQMSIRYFPDHAMAYNSLAAYWNAQHDPSKAMAALATAHRLDPKDPLVVTNLALLYEKAGDLSKARAFYTEALTLDADPDLKANARAHLVKLAKLNSPDGQA